MKPIDGINFGKIVSGTISSMAAWLTGLPMWNLLELVLIFVLTDFVVGCFASYKREKRKGKRWFFQSKKAWDTVYKLAFSMIAIALAWTLTNDVFPFGDIPLANVITAFICGVEFWSFLENAAEISHHKLFLWLKKYTKKKFESVDKDLAEVIEESEKEPNNNIKKE